MHIRLEQQPQSKIHSKQVSQAGSSLIELILYMAILAIFLTSAVLFAWNVILSSEKSTTQRVVTQNIRLANERISTELKNASSILDLSANAICLESANPTYNPTYIHLVGDSITLSWGGGSSDCTNLINTQSLTSGNLVASNLEFAYITNNADSIHVQFGFTLEATGSRSEWQYQQSTVQSVEIRN